MQKIKKLFSSDVMSDITHTQKVAYIAVMTALCVVCNMFFEFKLADTQFSLTIFFSALTGTIIGPIFGFVACFLGDLVGFLYNSGGYMYYPWVGISMGLIALIAGLVMNLVNIKNKFAIFIKLLVIAVLTFLLCTVAISTTSFWIVYDMKSSPYFAYLFLRLFIRGQIWNSIVNYALLFILYPTILRIKTAIKR